MLALLLLFDRAARFAIERSHLDIAACRFLFASNPALATIELPKLKSTATFSFQVRVSVSPALPTRDAAAAFGAHCGTTHPGVLGLVLQSTNVRNLTLPSLTSVTSSFTLSGCVGLAAFSAPNFTTITGNFQIQVGSRRASQPVLLCVLYVSVCLSCSISACGVHAEQRGVDADSCAAIREKQLTSHNCGTAPLSLSIVRPIQDGVSPHSLCCAIGASFLVFHSPCSFHRTIPSWSCWISRRWLHARICRSQFHFAACGTSLHFTMSRSLARL